MEFEELASGYCFLEAPRVAGEHVWFTDLLLGGLHRLAPGGRIDSFLDERKHIGGICFNEDGRLICGGPGGIVWFDAQTGETGAVLDGIEGELFTGSNDFIPDGRGGLYFGTLSSGGDYEQENVPTAIWRIDADGHAVRLDDGLKFANGMGLSPDGKRLYHCESMVGIFAYDLTEDGNFAGKTLFNERIDGDGLAVDAEGGVWAACFDSGVIVRLNPDGTEDRKIALPQPHKVVTSLCFGGPDWRDLYITTGGSDGVNSMMRSELPAREASLFRTRSDIAGKPVPTTRFRTS